LSRKQLPKGAKKVTARKLDGKTCWTQKDKQFMRSLIKRLWAFEGGLFRAGPWPHVAAFASFISGSFRQDCAESGSGCSFLFGFLAFDAWLKLFFPCWQFHRFRRTGSSSL